MCFVESSEVAHLQSYSPDDATLVITWEPPAVPDVTVLNYTVSITNLRDGDTVRQQHISITNTTQSGLGMKLLYATCTILISCLFYAVAGVPYNVSIAAVNRAGPGEFSVIIHFTQELGIHVANASANAYIIISHSTNSTQECYCYSALSYCHGGVMASPELL